MSSRLHHPTDAGVKYREVTEEFARGLPVIWRKLNRQNGQLARNAEVTRLFGGTVRSSEGDALRTCGTHREARDAKDLLLFRQYCRRLFSCSRCASVLAEKEAKRLFLAAELFSKRIERADMRLNSYVIMPDSFRIPCQATDAFPEQTKLLNRFLDRLQRHQAEHNVAWLERTTSKRNPKKERLKQLMGPTVGSIHLVPNSESDDQYAHAHLHLGIVTPREYAKERVTETIETLFTQAKADVGINYVPRIGHEEVREMKKRHIFRDGIVPDELKNTTWGQLKPKLKKGDKGFDEAVATQNQLTMEAFNYLSRPFKRKWTAEGIAEARQMCDMLGMPPHKLHRRFGLLGAKRQAMPSAPPMNPNDIEFVADFDDRKGWTIRTPFAMDANGKWVRIGECSPNPKPYPTLV